MSTAANTQETEAPRMIAGVNLQKLKDDDLRELSQHIETEISARRQKATTELVAEFRAKAEKIGLDPVTVAALFAPRAPSRARRGSGDKRGTVAAKYRNPANPAQTWAGRGVKPAWIELGPDKKPLAKFRIPEPPAQ